MERKVSDAVKRRFEKALELLNIDELDRTRLKIFTVIGFDTFHAGTSYSVYGSLIGVPFNYAFENKSEIPRSEIVLNGSGSIDWSSDAGKMYEESLLLTENEQLFGICREILHTRTIELPLKCLYTVVFPISAYAMASTVNRKLMLFKRPVGMRMVLYTLVGLFWYGNYSLVTDFTHCKYEVSVDKQLSELGDDMVKVSEIERMVLRKYRILFSPYRLDLATTIKC